MLKLTAITMLVAALPAIADPDINLLTKIPEQADWYQQLETSRPLTKPNTFTVIDPNFVNNYSALTIQTKPFTTINLNGSYQVEIIGQSKTSTIEILGSEQDILNTQVVVDANTHSLSLSQKQPTTKTIHLKITTPIIETLVNNGNSNLNAKDLNGDAITVINNGNGNIFITGDANFKQITLNGQGNIDVNQGTADASTIINNGNGNLTMQGNYAIKTLTDHGNGSIRIDGINTRGLTINSQGNGDIVLSGFGNLEALLHTGNGNVFFYWVDSQHAAIRATGKGVIGLAGAAKQVDAVIQDQVVFDGRYLKADNLDLKTQDNARAKVIAKQQLTAAAADQSQSFYYNKPTSVLKYSTGSGIVSSMP